MRADRAVRARGVGTLASVLRRIAGATAVLPARPEVWRRGRGAAGAGAGLLPKSTFGGALIAASFSTVKLGFTSILNSIAVRLVGN